MNVIFVMVIENTHNKVSLKVKMKCDRSVFSETEVVLIKTLEVGVMKNKYQRDPREKCFQFISIFLFCVRESSSPFFFSWILRGFFVLFFVLGIKPKAFQMARHAYTQSVTVHLQQCAHLSCGMVDFTPLKNNMCCQVTWTLGVLSV